MAQSIVVNAFSILLGAFGLAVALALGLGSKELVQQWLAQFSPPKRGEQTPPQQPK